jgi:hypothetical protein
MTAGDTVIGDYTTASPIEIKARLDFLKNKTTDYTPVEQGEIVMAIEQLQSRVNENPANLLEVSNTELVSFKTQIAEAKKDLKIAEDRVSTLRHPEKDRSYYESWFPLNRPLTNRSIIIILAIGVFFLVISFLIILRIFGFNLQFSSPWDNPELVNRVSGFLPPFITQNFSKIVNILMIIIAVVFIVLYVTKA